MLKMNSGQGFILAEYSCLGILMFWLNFVHSGRINNAWSLRQRFSKTEALARFSTPRPPVKVNQSDKDTQQQWIITTVYNMTTIKQWQQWQRGQKQELENKTTTEIEKKGKFYML